MLNNIETMKIALITGSYPPSVCGVGQYTHCLAQALESLNIKVTIITDESWKPSRMMDILRRIDRGKPDIVHMQYPTVGYRASLLPQMISLLRSCVITIHEVSQAHILRQLSLYPFTLRSRHLIFTTAFERAYAIGRAPWIARRSSVIPIGNNMLTKIDGTKQDRSGIVYFGLIRPNKGIEDVIALASLIRQASLEIDISIIGKTHPRHHAYALDLQRRTSALPVQWNMDLPDERVAELLEGARIAYLPFPDGTSERRGSLLAVLSHGVATITTRGPQTTGELERAVAIVQGPEQALAAVYDILNNPEYERRLSRQGRAYTARFSWDAIARRHQALYEQIMRSGR